MPVHKWHAGPLEVREEEGVQVLQVFALFDTPTGSNVASLTYTSIMANRTTPPTWVTLDTTDEADLAAGTLFGRTYAVKLDIDRTNVQKQARLNALYDDQVTVEQAYVTDTYLYYGFSETSA